MQGESIKQRILSVFCRGKAVAVLETALITVLVVLIATSALAQIDALPAWTGAASAAGHPTLAPR